MKTISIHTIAALLMTLAVAPCFAQYAGGCGRGDAMAQLLNTPLGAFEAAVYNGGCGSGDATAQLLNVPLSAFEAAVYSGSCGRGDISAQLLNTPLSAFEAAVYSGGCGRGDAAASLLNIPLGAVETSVYQGGCGRGDAMAQLTNTPLGDVEASVYKGGCGRGDATASLLNAPLGAVEALAYAGGCGRGDAMASLLNSPLGSPIICALQDIVINIGWNMISSYINPEIPDMADIFSEIVADIIIVKDNLGQAYLPSLNINTIGDWEVEQGYKVKASNSATLTMGCEQVDPVTTPIMLSAGWNMISYLRTSILNAVAAIGNIAANTVLMKDINGDSYIPSLNINTIGDLKPGQGYKIKMSNGDTLYYPANAKILSAGYYNDSRKPAHFSPPKKTGHNATIIISVESIEGLGTGDEIGIFNQQGMLAGAAVFEGRHLSVAVWGDDPTTDEVDGLSINDNFVYRIWSAGEQAEYSATTAYESGDVTYQNDGVSVLKKLEVKNLLEMQAELNIYPNPTEGILNIEYYLPEKDAIELSILDVYGNELFRQELKNKVKGKHTMIVDVSEFSAGLYICDFQSGSISRAVKIQKY